MFLCDNCDMAGVWKVDLQLAGYYLGVQLDEAEVIKAFDGRIQPLDGHKWYLCKFIRFQYPHGLTETNGCHRGVIRLLKENNLDYQSLLVAPAKGLGRGYVAPQDTEQDQVKDQVQVQGKVPVKEGEGTRGGEPEKKPSFTPPTLDEMRTHAATIDLPAVEAERCHSYYESNGWRVGKNPMKNWKAAMNTWRGNWQQSTGQLANQKTDHTKGF
jgi:hypothetical protein